jgi:sirohydrochlorin cobaltochelatase
LEISYARELGIDLKLIRAAGERVEDALQKAGDGVSREDTLLVVVGRGASDPDANSNVAKVTRMLWEGLGLGWAETAYSGVTFPLVEPGLEHATRLGYKRIVVFPYFLFTGILVQRIYHYTDIVAAKHPEIEFIKASYLNDHPLVLDAFAERVEEIRNGENNMNCQLCKYREQFLGFENEVGLRQESHHHHVEGVGTGTDESSDAVEDAHSHVHEHSHDHNHNHGHHPYPHADHPLGPVTLEEKSGKSGAE